MDKKFTMHVDVDSFIPATEEEKAYMVQMRPSSTFFLPISTRRRSVAPLPASSAGKLPPRVRSMKTDG